VNFLYPLEEAKKKWNNQKIAKPHFGREAEEKQLLRQQKC
jgi:hypothetical protein